MLYGSSTIYTGGATATWNSGYKGVWHLGNNNLASLSVIDSTGLNTSINNATASAGKIDGGASFSGSAYIDSGGTLGKSYSGLCAQCWFNVSSSATSSTALGTFNSLTDMSFELDVVNGTNSQMVATILTGATLSTVTQTDMNSNNTWILAHITWDGSTLSLYKNGVLNNSTASTAFSLSNTQTKNFTMGAQNAASGGAKNIKGLLDEVRVSNVNRTKDWILTEYNNQNSPGNIGTASFLSFSNEY